MSELARCPFCGGEAEKVAVSEAAEYALECRGCGAGSPIVTAIKDEPDGHLQVLWNRRSPQAAAAALLADEGAVERMVAEIVRAMNDNKGSPFHDGLRAALRREAEGA